MTPLIIAAQEGNIDAVRLLLISKADPRIVATCGISPLAMAMLKGNKEIISLIEASLSEQGIW